MTGESLTLAIATSTAAGKNAWLPLGVVLATAAAPSLPDWVMSPRLHGALHDLAPPWVLGVVGGVFLVLAVLASIADKIEWIEVWLTPISTAWRPLSAIVVSSLIAVAASSAERNAVAVAAEDATASAVGLATDVGLSAASSLVTVALGAVFGVLATIGKTGTRLVLTLVPVPGVRAVHSIADDAFALSTTFGAFVLPVWLVGAAATVYLAVGLVTGPILGRLTLIHFRIGASLAARGWRRARGLPPPETAVPSWVGAALAAAGVEPSAAAVLPAYSFRAPVTGLCRGGFLVISPAGVWFAARALFGGRFLRLDADRVTRVALAESVTRRSIVVCARTGTGEVRSTSFHLFPLEEPLVTRALAAGTAAAGLSRVLVASESARRALPGYERSSTDTRFVPAGALGSLRIQAVATVVAAAIGGAVTLGTVVPVGAGYLASPFKGRAAACAVMTLYLTACALTGVGWPIAVLYAVVLNAVAIRDLVRQSLCARTDGFVDRRRFLPLPSRAVWVPSSRVDPRDTWREGADEPIADGSWRDVVRALGTPATAAARA